MAFLDKLGNTISNASKEGISKAKDLGNTAKLSFDIKDQESTIQKLYRQLGKAYYDDHKDDANPVYAQIAQITEALEKIEDSKDQKREIKGICICPQCGEKIDITSKFCPKCGAVIEHEEPAESAAEPEAVSDDVSAAAEETIEVLQGDVVE